VEDIGEAAHVVEDVGEEVAGGVKNGEAQISEGWRMKWWWWFLQVRRIGTTALQALRLQHLLNAGGAVQV
jgi:hypothetical protein